MVDVLAGLRLAGRCYGGGHGRGPATGHGERSTVKDGSGEPEWDERAGVSRFRFPSTL